MSFGGRIVEDARWQAIRRAMAHEAVRAVAADDARRHEPPPGSRPAAAPLPGRTCRR